MTPETALATIATAYGGKKLVEKILGPTAEYLGAGVKDFAEKRVQNVKAIFQVAEKKLGDRINEPGSVPPKVLKEILAEGSYTTDPIGLEYFGGVLASSRTAIDRDDRAASLMKLIASMSAYQLRCHFVFYTIIRRLYTNKTTKQGAIFNLGIQADREALQTFIGMDAFIKAMDFTEKENLSALLPHVSFGLHDIGLIDKFQFGGDEPMVAVLGKGSRAGMMFMPTARGAELFLWSHGLGSRALEDFLKPELDTSCMVDVTVPEDYLPVSEINARAKS